MNFWGKRVCSEIWKTQKLQKFWDCQNLGVHLHPRDLGVQLHPQDLGVHPQNPGVKDPLYPREGTQNPSGSEIAPGRPLFIKTINQRTQTLTQNGSLSKRDKGLETYGNFLRQNILLTTGTTNQFQNFRYFTQKLCKIWWRQSEGAISTIKKSFACKYFVKCLKVSKSQKDFFLNLHCPITSEIFDKILAS